MNHCSTLRHSRTHRKAQASRVKLWHLIYTMALRSAAVGIRDAHRALVEMETSGQIKACGPLISEELSRCFRISYLAPSDTDWSGLTRLGWQVSGPFSPPSSQRPGVGVIPRGN